MNSLFVVPETSMYTPMIAMSNPQRMIVSVCSGREYFDCRFSNSALGAV